MSFSIDFLSPRAYDSILNDQQESLSGTLADCLSYFQHFWAVFGTLLMLQKLKLFHLTISILFYSETSYKHQGSLPADEYVRRSRQAMKVRPTSTK